MLFVLIFFFFGLFIFRNELLVSLFNNFFLVFLFWMLLNVDLDMLLFNLGLKCFDDFVI